MSRPSLTIGALIVAGALPAQADICSGRSGRNARAVTGCPSIGATIALTPVTKGDIQVDDAEKGGALLVLDAQYPLSVFVARAKIFAQGGEDSAYNLAGGLAWVHHFPNANLSVDLGVEYTPPFAGDARAPLTLPTLGRYLTPDTQQIAGQFSLGYNGPGKLDLRTDAELVQVFEGDLDPYTLVQAGATGAWSMNPEDFWGIRFGFDYMRVMDGPRAAQTFLGAPGVQVYSQYIDAGAGLGIVVHCPEASDCSGRPLFLFDLALSLGVF